MGKRNDVKDTELNTKLKIVFAALELKQDVFRSQGAPTLQKAMYKYKVTFNAKEEIEKIQGKEKARE